MQNRLRQKWQTFKCSDSGVSAIEFVFVAPVIFLIMGVTLETGFMMFTQFSLQGAVEDAARNVRTGAMQMGGWSAANFKTKICTSVGAIVDCNNITVYVGSAADFTTLQARMPPILNIGPTTGVGTTSAPACYNPGAPAQPAIAVATYDWYFVSMGMSVFGNVAGNTARRLAGVTLFKNQTYPGAFNGTCP